MDVILLGLRLLLAVLLYAFLAVVLFMLWRDLRQAAVGHQVARPEGRLVVLDTPEDEISAGMVFPLQPVTSIGRSPTNAILLPDTYASGQHSLLSWREGQWWLEDLDSRNGTLLNGTRVTSPTVVSAGDVIRVGRTELRLELG